MFMAEERPELPKRRERFDRNYAIRGIYENSSTDSHIGVWDRRANVGPGYPGAGCWKFTRLGAKIHIALRQPSAGRGLSANG